ncbi:MAG: hypothetical protein K9K67_02840 [Bacteriovoracaceae bacterium]|nr:hypothetical protein [Bacteriovoracaceae bacterium]
MKYFEQAQENLKRSNFYKALELFEISIREEALSKELKIFCCEKIEKINEILKKDSTKSLLEFLANNYFELGHFEKAHGFYGKLFRETKKPTYLYKQFISKINEGNISDALVLANRYLEELLKYRLSDQIIFFINENNKIFKDIELSLWRLKAFFLSGDIRSLEAEVNLWKDFRATERREIFETAINLTGHNAKYWHSSKIILNAFWDNLYQEERPYQINKKRIIKLMLDYWLLVNKDHDLIESSVDISKKYGLSVVGHELAKFVGDGELIDYFLNRMPRKAFIKENYDFGEDLFGQGEQNKIQKVERDIKFLIKSGSNAEALRLTYDLEKLDPKNPLIQKVIGDRGQENFFENEKKIEDLLIEIDRYVPEKILEENYEDSFISVVKHYEVAFIDENYEDIIIGFNLINLPRVALEIIKRVSEKNLNERDLVNLKYLEIETLLSDSQNYIARDKVEDALSKIPLLPEERLAMTYLRAEAYYSLNNWPYALKLFQDIFRKNPGYRLTNERIKVIERNK